ncbi:MAG: nuclear export factor [Candidatus Taylorbacteria bacterium]|nr:nuclear export factor [Candidatus Taylorbacteria bacterium]
MNTFNAKFRSAASKIASFCAVAAIMLAPAVSSAHVVVTPNTAAGTSYQTFSIGVPSERESSTVSIRLAIPELLSSVRPNVKPGWKIDIHSAQKGTSTVVTEIVWSGGSIPAGFRDDFAFSVKTPASGSIIWKAYQTYADGKTFAWDAQPAAEHGHDHESVSGPYSTTKIIAAPAGAMMRDDDGGDMHMDSDMHDSDASAAPSHADHSTHDLILPLIAIGLALVALMEIEKLHKKIK